MVTVPFGKSAVNDPSNGVARYRKLNKAVYSESVLGCHHLKEEEKRREITRTYSIFPDVGFILATLTVSVKYRYV